MTVTTEGPMKSFDGLGTISRLVIVRVVIPWKASDISLPLPITLAI